MATAPTVLSKVIVNMKEGEDAAREVSHATTSIDGVKYAIVRGVNEKGQRYLDQFDLETKKHEKRPLQGGADALVIMSDAGLMGITSGGKMQVFNMALRQVVSSAALPASGADLAHVKYWKFSSAQLVAIYASDGQIYTWNLATANAAPVALFKMQDSLLAGTVVDIQASEDAQWFAVVVRAEPLEQAKQNVQLYSTGRSHSSVLEAAAASVYAHAVRGCTIMALASKGPQGFRLLVAELATAPGAPKFERLVLELPSTSVPVALLLQGNDQNVLSVITQHGDIHVANIETRAWITHSKLGSPGETFFTGATSIGFNHIVALSTSGSAYAVAPLGPAQHHQQAAASASSSSVTITTEQTAPHLPPASAYTPPPPKDPLSELSLQSMVEPKKPQNPLEEFFASYPPEALSLYKNERAKFLPFFRERSLTLNWQGLMDVDKDMSTASKLAFGHALAHMELASRGSIVTFFESKGYLDDNFAKANYMLELLGNSNSPADADLQTNAVCLGLSVNPSLVVSSLVGKKWTHFDNAKVSEAALAAQQWDLVWLLAVTFEQRIQLLSMHSMSISPNQVLPWFNSLPADGSLTVLETLHTARAMAALSWERVAAPPNDRLAPHLDLTISPPFQTLRVKIASSGDSKMWERYISLLVNFGESKELSRILLQYSNDATINTLAENAVKMAAPSGSIVAALPLLIIAERSNKLEDLVTYHLGRAHQGLNFLIAYATSIQPQNAARVIAIVAQQSAASDNAEAVKEILLACAQAEVLPTSALWLASNQTSVVPAIATVVSQLVAQHTDVPLLVAYNAKFNSTQ